MWTLANSLNNTGLPPLPRLRRGGLLLGWSTSHLQTCANLLQVWRTSLRNWKASPLNSLSDIMKQTKHLPRFQNVLPGWKNKLIFILIFTAAAGCANLKEVDASITGIELEYYEPRPVVFVHTNTIPQNSRLKLFPKLMDHPKIK